MTVSKRKQDPSWYEEIVQKYLSGEASAGRLSEEYQTNERTIYRWVQQYKAQGIAAFISRTGNRRYAKEFKKECVERYLSGQMSVDEIAARYGISNESVLRDWIKRYNANMELKDYDPKREVYMAGSRRKTTLEERKEIVKYCISHGRDYKNTAALYDVSYSQVYTWVKKYTADGDEGLADRRGQHKSDEEVDELERLRRENLRLKRQLEERDMLVELLKKVKEFEGR